MHRETQEVTEVVSLVLRARRNEKEMKVKPATSFKLLTIFIHKKNKIRFKTKECKFTVPVKFMSQSPSKIIHKNL